MDAKIDFNRLTATEIDDILDEIEHKEQRQNGNQQENENNNVNWNEIVNQIRNINLNFIKNLITSNDVDINAQNPKNGKTLLIYGVIIGNIDLVKLMCNFGADVHIKDNDNFDVLDYAIKYGRYKITELIYYQQLSGSLGNTLKDIASKIHEENQKAKEIKEAGRWKRINNELFKSTNEFMMQAMEKRIPFSADLMYYAWYYNLNNGLKPLESKLWSSMMKTFTAILSNTDDKKGWSWLKRYFINSLIWFLPHPEQENKDKKNEKEEDDDKNDIDSLLKKTLFYELLVRVRAESKKQSDLLLKEKISKIRSEKPNDWDSLVKYNINTKYSKNARQDLCGCLVSKYNEQDLSEEKYPPSTHFSAKKHYDTNIYLNELLFTANIIDTEFQQTMKQITKEISQENNINVLYRAGPVKTLNRSQTKVENDYINEDYPKAAKILDINRCALQFQSPNEMMKYIQIFTAKIKNKNAGPIIDIIRCKNGWSIYNSKYPQYTDIKLNILFQSVYDKTKIIITEIQFLLSIMSGFKKKSHKLYSVERKFELVYNFSKLKREMSAFKDIDHVHTIIKHLAINNDIKYFIDLFVLINPNYKTLIGGDKITKNRGARLPIRKKKKNIFIYNESDDDFDESDESNSDDLSEQFFDADEISKNVWDTALFHIMLRDKFHHYLQSQHNNLYWKTITNYIQQYGLNHSWDDMFKSIASKDSTQYILKTFFSLIKNNENRKKYLLSSLFHYRELASTRTTFIEGICLYSKSAMKAILNSKLINDNDKCKLILPGNIITPFVAACKNNQNSQNAVEILNFFKNDNKKMVYKLLNQRDINNYCLTALKAICKNKYGDSILKFILNRIPCLNDKDKKYLFFNKNTVTNIINNICVGKKDKKYLFFKKSAYDGSLFIIFDYFENLENGKKEIIKLLQSKKLKFDAYHPSLILRIHKRYFNGNKSFLFTQLKQNKIFKKICEGETQNITLKFILYKSPLNDIDRLDLINDIIKNPWPKDVDSYYTIYYYIQVIRYLINNRKQLLQFLNTVDEKGKTVWYKLCVDNMSEDILSLILRHPMISDHDKYKLLSTNDKYKTPTLMAAFQLSGSSGCKNAEIILESFAGCKNIDFLLKLLTQKTPRGKCFLQINAKSDLETLFGVLNYNKKIINNLLGRHKINEFAKDKYRVAVTPIIEEWNQYLKFDELIKDEEENINNIDINKLTNGFIILCKYGKIKTIEKLINNIKDNKKEETLIKLLSQKEKIKVEKENNKFDWVEKENETALMKIVSSEYHKFHNNKAKLLKILLLNNYISDKEKYKLLSITDACDAQQPPAKKTVFLKATNECRLLIIHYFNNKKNKKYLLKLLKQLVDVTDSDYLSSTNLNDKEKLKLQLIHLTKCEDPKILLQILNFIKNDKKQLNKILCNKLYFIKKALFKACKNKNNSQNAQQIIEYLSTQKKQWIEALKYVDEYKRTYLIAAIEYQNDGKVIELILQSINKMDYKLQSQILMKKRYNKYFIWEIEDEKDMKIVLRVLNNTIIEQLLNDEDNNGRTIHQQLRDTNGGIYKYFIEILITKFIDYLQFDKLLSSIRNNKKINLLFNEYATNPFITACSFGKSETIKKLLNYIGGNKEKLTLLLLNNYNKENGNNCLMELAANNNDNDNKIIIDIIEFLNIHNLNHLKSQLLSTKNKYSAQTLLMLFCKNNSNFKIITKIISNISDKKLLSKLLKQKDNKNKTCLDYSPSNISKSIKNYL